MPNIQGRFFFRVNLRSSTGIVQIEVPEILNLLPPYTMQSGRLAAIQIVRHKMISNKLLASKKTVEPLTTDEKKYIKKVTTGMLKGGNKYYIQIIEFFENQKPLINTTYNTREVL
jgi:hypothetical protein